MHHFRQQHAKTFKAVFACLTIIFCLFMFVPAMAQDPTGSATGTIKDLGIDTLAAPKDSALSKVVATVNTIGNNSGHNKIAINLMWTLIAGFPVTCILCCNTS